jgi:hypothetical protein
MFFRKWLVRGLVALVLAASLGAGVVYQQWTNPAAVRQQVVDMLQQQFPGASISLDGARLQWLGGVVLTELRLLRRGSNVPGGQEDGSQAEQVDFLHIPRAIVYPDKQRLLDGEFPIQRIELEEPLIRIIHNKDGQWNVEGLVGKADPTVPLPTFVIKKGTLVLEDKAASPIIWELHDLNATLVTDSNNCLTFNGTGQSETLGTVELSGSWKRSNNAMKLSWHVTGLNINRDLVDYLTRLFPNPQLDGLKIEGKAESAGDLVYQPGATPALQYRGYCQLRQTCVESSKLPVPLHNLSALLRCGDGKLVLEKLKAAAGAGKVECNGWADLADVANTFGGQVTVYHLPLSSELAKGLPDDVRRLHDKFQPEGSVKAQIVAEKQKGVWMVVHCTMEPDDISICFEKFKYPLDRVTGTIAFDYLQFQTKFDLVGYSGTRPIALKGCWKGQHEKAEATIEVSGQDVLFDDKVLEALPGDKRLGLDGGIQGLAASFHPTGKGTFRSVTQRFPGNLEFQNTYQIHFQDCTAKWDVFPYPLENVSGDLVIYPRSPTGHEQYEFANFKGTHNGGEVYVQGGTLPRPGAKDDGKLVVNLAGQNFCMDGDLKEALTTIKKMTAVWDKFKPTGRIDFQAQIERLPGQPRDKIDMDIGVDVKGCTTEPSFFPYELTDVTGQVRYRKNKVELSNFTARHNKTLLSVKKGTVDFVGNDGFFVELDELRGNPVLADEDLLRAMPKALRTSTEMVSLKDFAIQTKLVVSQADDPHATPEIFWDGELHVRDAHLRAGIDLDHVTGTFASRGLCDGRQIAGLCGNIYLDEATALKQPFHGVRSHFVVLDKTPDTVTFTLDAPILGGDISGRGQLQFNSTFRYEIDLTASQIPLKEIGRQNWGPREQLDGIAAGRLYLRGQGSGLSGLEGDGSIDVPYSPTTRLLTLGPLLDLLKFLGLRWPDRTAFEEAHAAFAIHGNRVSIGKLELQGNAVSLYGKGEVDLATNDLLLDMYTSWGRAEQWLPPGIRTIPSSISKQFVKIEVRGKLGGNEGDLKFTKRLVPGLTGPFLEMRNQWMGNNNR